jgi:hypothetical protein
VFGPLATYANQTEDLEDTIEALAAVEDRQSVGPGAAAWILAG